MDCAMVLLTIERRIMRLLDFHDCGLWPLAPPSLSYSQPLSGDYSIAFAFYTITFSMKPCTDIARFNSYHAISAATVSSSSHSSTTFLLFFDKS